VTRTILFLLPLTTCAARIHAHNATGPVTEEVARSLCVVRHVASRRTIGVPYAPPLHGVNGDGPPDGTTSERFLPA